MTDQGYLEVKNWKKFQHYKDRSPLWIKLYRDTLGDYAFSRLQDASKMHLIGIWLLASELDGLVPNDPEWIGKRIGATEEVNVQVLIESGFLLLARRKQDASRALAKRLPREEKRREEIAGPKKTWLTPFSDLWATRCGEPPFGKLAKVLGPLIEQHGEAEVLLRWKRYLNGTEPRFCSVHRFAETFNSWAEPETKEMTDDFGVMQKFRKGSDGEWHRIAVVA